MLLAFLLAVLTRGRILIANAQLIVIAFQ